MCTAACRDDDGGFYESRIPGALAAVGESKF